MRDDAGGASDFRFRKRERIRARRDIGAVFQNGAKWSVKGMRLHVLRTDGAGNRAVFVTVRKYGDAVRRNRARRVVSECYRLNKASIGPGHDLAFVIFPGPDDAVSRRPQVLELLRRSGLVRANHA